MGHDVVLDYLIRYMSLEGLASCPRSAVRPMLVRLGCIALEVAKASP